MIIFPTSPSEINTESGILPSYIISQNREPTPPPEYSSPLTPLPPTLPEIEPVSSIIPAEESTPSDLTVDESSPSLIRSDPFTPSSGEQALQTPPELPP